MQIAKQRSLSHDQSQRIQVETTEPSEPGVQGMGGGRQLLAQVTICTPKFSNFPAALDKTTEFGAQSNDQELASYTHHAEL